MVLRHALALAETALGGDDIDVATVLISLGLLRKDQGRFDECEPIYWRALVITEQTLGSDHPNVADLYTNLGDLEHARGRYAESEAYARRSLAIREQASPRATCCQPCNV